MRRRVTWILRPEIYYRGVRCFGLAHPDTWTIEIDPAFHRSERQLMETSIHELLHLVCPEKNEKQVTRIAKFLNSELWRRGYRQER